jgi:hypothetical protein
MKVKVHWVIDGIAEIDAENIQEAEVLVKGKLEKFVLANPALEEELGANAIQGKGYLPGSNEVN